MKNQNPSTLYVNNLMKKFLAATGTFSGIGLDVLFNKHVDGLTIKAIGEKHSLKETRVRSILHSNEGRLRSLQLEKFGKYSALVSILIDHEIEPNTVIEYVYEKMGRIEPIHNLNMPVLPFNFCLAKGLKTICSLTNLTEAQFVAIDASPSIVKGVRAALQLRSFEFKEEG